MNKPLLVLTLALAAGGSAFAAETRTVNVNLTNTAHKAVPVSLSLLQLRDTLGAEFPLSFGSIRVSVGGAEVPYQIDDVDGNARVSAGDELSFMADAAAVITVSDDAAAVAPSYQSSFDVQAGTDATTVNSLKAPGFQVQVSKEGLTRITGYGKVQGLLADELGNARIEGFNQSTFYKDQNYGAYLEGKTTISGMTLVSTKILPAGPARVTVVSRYSSPDFVGLDQTVVSRIYTDGAVDVSSSFSFRGYTDLMKLEHQATRLVSELDPDAVHISPVFRRVGYADLAQQTPSAFYASTDRNAAVTVAGKTYLQFPVGANLKNPFWGGSYLFASPEAWRTNFSSKLGVGVAEISWQQPALAADYQSLIAGNQWQFESGEFRTGVFKWVPDELKPVPSAASVFTQPNPWTAHYFPGDKVEFRFVYDAYAATAPTYAVVYLENRARDLASVSITKG